MAISQRSFFGYQPRWFTLDRLYIICLGNGKLTGLRVSGQLWVTGFETKQWPDDPADYADSVLLAKYGRNTPHAIELHSEDKNNFQISCAEIESATFKQRKSWWTASIPNSGDVIFRLRSGKTQRFILLGRQEPNVVKDALTWAGISVSSFHAGIAT